MIAVGRRAFPHMNGRLHTQTQTPMHIQILYKIASIYQSHHHSDGYS